MIELVGCEGYIEGSSYIRFLIKGGKNSDSIGDQVWISPDGTHLEISDISSMEVINEATELFIPAHRKAFRGFLRRLEVIND